MQRPHRSSIAGRNLSVKIRVQLGSIQMENAQPSRMRSSVYVARRRNHPHISATLREIYVQIVFSCVSTLQMPRATGKSTSALYFLWQLVVDMLQ